MTRRRTTALVLLLAGSLTWSLLASLSDTSAAKAAAGSTVRASVAADGSAAPTGGYESALSGNGRYQVFISSSDLATPGAGADSYTGGLTQVYVRDLQANSTSQVSIGRNDGTVAVPNSSSYYPSISADGRYVSFVTSATDIVAPVDDGGQSVSRSIVVCDRGAPDANGRYSSPPAAGKPYPGYLRCAFVAYYGSQYNQLYEDGWPRLSGNGRRIVWADELQMNNTIYLATIRSAGGAVRTPDSVGSMPTTVPSFGENEASLIQPAISPDGEFVVAAARTYGGEDDDYAIVENRVVGGEFTMNRRVDASDVDRGAHIGDATTRVAHPQVSDGGTTVAFDASDLEASTPRSYPQVYAVTVGKPAAGTGLKSRLVSYTVAGGQKGFGDGILPTLSADGRYLGFVTDQPGMSDGIGALEPSAYTCVAPQLAGFAEIPQPSLSTDASGNVELLPRTKCQVVVRDLAVDRARAAEGRSPQRAQLASVARTLDCFDGQPTRGRVCNGSGDSGSDGYAGAQPSLSADGGVIAFDSVADDLVAGGRSAEDRAALQAFAHTWDTSVTAADLTFGIVKFGASTDRTVTLTAGGFGPVRIDGTKVTGANKADFSILSTTCSKSVPLHAGETCTVSLRFTPGALGRRSARLAVFTDGDRGTPKLSIAVTGTGSTHPPRHPDISVNPGTVDFGSDLPLHTPGKPALVIVSNPGGTPLTIHDVTVRDTSVPGADRDYTIDRGSCVAPVPSGATCAMTLTFVGHAVGSRPAVLVITSTAPGGSNAVALAGLVPAPAITLSPAVTPPGRVSTVTGTGFAPKRTVSVRLEGSGERAQSKADAAGGFSVGLVIFPNTDVGDRAVLARTAGASATISARTPLLVVLGTLQSPRLKIRH